MDFYKAELVEDPFFSLEFSHWDAVSSQTWLLPSGHRPFGIKIRSRWEVLLFPELAVMHYKFGVFQNAGQIVTCFPPQAPAFVSVRAVKGCAKAVVVKEPSRLVLVLVVDVLVVGQIMTFS